MSSPTNLANLSLNTPATITKLAITGMLKQRLLDMGVLVGDSIIVTKIAPLGDPIEVKIKGYKLSLRKADAQNIYINHA